VIVAHMDLDAFYAAVEELENPDLRSQPLIVGGDPRGRGVATSGTYVRGIHWGAFCAQLNIFLRRRRHQFQTKNKKY